MSSAPKDDNRIPALLGVSSSDGTTPVTVYTDPSTHRLYVDTTVTAATVLNQTVNIAYGTVGIGPGSATIGTVTIGSIGSLQAGSNTIGTVTLSAGGATIGTVTIGALSAGSNTIGTVTIGALQAGSNEIGTVQVSVLPSVTVGSLPALPAGSNQIGTVQVSVLPSVTVGSLPALPTGSNTIGTVSITPNSAVNVAQIAGTNAVTSISGSLGVGGDTASGSTDAGNPVKVGGLAKTSNPTAVSDGQRVAGLFDKVGKQVAVGAIRELKGFATVSINNSTATTTVVPSVSNTFLDVYGCIVSNTASAANKVTFTDSTNGAPKFVIEVPSTDVRGFMLPVDSAIPQASSTNIWQAQCGTSGSIEITMLFVKNV